METTVNERVVLLKTQMNLTIDEFCLKTKMSRTTLWNIQNGGEMKPKTTNIICETFNVNKDWLLHGKGKMFSEAPKVEVSNNDPWKDALVSQVKEENNRLIEQVRWLQQMVSQFTNGVKPNFLKATDVANTLLFPNKKQLIKVRARA